MKIFVAILVLLALAVYFLYPPVNSERICYETAQQSNDTLQVNVISRGLSKQAACEQQMDIVSSLESCIQTATASATVSQFSGDLIPRLLVIIRPYSKNIFTQKTDHNNDCADYSWTQL